MQSAYANRNKEEHSEVVELVKEQVQEHFGDTQHDQDAVKLVQNAHEKMNRMPVDKVRPTVCVSEYVALSNEKTDLKSIELLVLARTCS